MVTYGITYLFFGRLLGRGGFDGIAPSFFCFRHQEFFKGQARWIAVNLVGNIHKAVIVSQKVVHRFLAALVPARESNHSQFLEERLDELHFLCSLPRRLDLAALAALYAVHQLHIIIQP